MSFSSLGLDLSLTGQPRAPRLCRADAGAARSDSRGAGGRRPAGLVADRQRQDRGLRAAGAAAPAHAGEASRARARACWCSRPRASSRCRCRRRRTATAAGRSSPPRCLVGGMPFGAQLAQVRKPLDIVDRHARAASRTTWTAAAWTSSASSSWCSTRPTACSTWASTTRSTRSSRACRRSARRCSSPRRSPAWSAGSPRA